jgi:hypothetical protein
MRLAMPLAFIGCRTNGPSDSWEDPIIDDDLYRTTGLLSNPLNKIFE